MADNQFTAPSSHNPAKNRTMVKIGERKPILDVEFNEMQEIQNHLRAEMYRAMTHSGVLSHLGVTNTIFSLATGQVGVPYNALSLGLKTSRNFIDAMLGDVLINGYKITVDSNYDGVKGLTRIDLPAPPTFGTREDLVFLEAWFEEMDTVKDPSIIDSRIGAETNRRIQLKWRIRTVAGVDFNKSSFDGLTASNDWGYNTATNYVHNVTPQGPGVVPTTAPSITDSVQDRIIKLFRKANVSSSSYRFSDDVGLYVAGDGSTISKSALGTLDGYVYAIPLFRVKRRNSGGFRNDNLNGGREYFASPDLTFDSGISTYVAGMEYTFTVSSGSRTAFNTIASKIKPGDYITNGTLSSKLGTILSVDLANYKITFRCEVNATDSSPAQWADENIVAVSDRPDGKWADIIDKDDIVDLRHKVSLTGYNYQQLLEENFDKLLRGELQTKDKPVMVKERFGLSPAPLGLAPQLAPVKVKGNDGITRELTNILGTTGLATSTADFIALLSTISTGENGIVSTSNSTGGFGVEAKPVSVKQGTPYLVGVQIKNINASQVQIFARKADSTTIKSSGLVNLAPNEAVFMYLKLSASDLNAIPDIKVYARGIATASGQQICAGKFMVYEIDQATYDKIDVDPAFTGGELAKKFPYVSSYRNIMENLSPVSFYATTFTTGGLSGDQAVSIIAKNVKVKPNTTYKVFAKSLTYARRISVFAHNNESTATTHNTLYNQTVGASTGREFQILDSDVADFIEFTTGANENYITITTSNYTSGNFPGKMVYEKIGIFEKASGVPDVYVPSGRWLVPSDYANKEVSARIPGYSNLPGRHMWSDMQINNQVNEFIDPADPKQRAHITLTQAAAGRWSVNDKITIRSTYGVITGVVDSDTAGLEIVTLTSNQSGGSLVLPVKDTSKYAVNDSLIMVTPYTLEVYSSTPLPVTAIDSANKTITVTNTPSYSLQANIAYGFIEVTTSSSVPQMSNEDALIAGTWSGLGTNEAIFTITTAPTNNTKPIRAWYNIAFPQGSGMDNVPSEVLGAKINGEQMVKANDGIVRVKGNFNRKIPGSTDLIPHSAKVQGSTTMIQAPSFLASSEFGVLANTSYEPIMKLDGTTQFGNSGTTNGVIPQQLFSFNVVRMIEDKFGEQVFWNCFNLADKVSIAKSIITKIRLNWWGYGTGPNGNKAYIKVWNHSITGWSSNDKSHNEGTSALLSFPSDYYTATPGFLIDANGFTHFVAYPDASTSSLASSINTDYVELELEMDMSELGYDMLIPENPFPVLVDDPKRYVPGENMMPEYKWEIGGIDGSTGINVETDTRARTIAYIPIEPNKEYSMKILGGSSGCIVCFYDSRGSYVSSSNRTADPEHSAISPDNARYARLAVVTRNNVPVRELKVMFYQGALSDVTEYKPCTKNIKRRRILDFYGKVANSTFEIPHRAFFHNNTTFTAPSGITEPFDQWGQANVDGITKLDGSVVGKLTSASGHYAMQMFEFDLSHLGFSLAELKSVVRKLVFKWTGYGKGTNSTVVGFGARVKAWSVSGGNWQPSDNSWNNTTSTPSLVSSTINGSDPTPYITNDQKVYLLAHSTYPAGTASQAELHTDYVSLEIELAEYVDYVKSNAVKVQKDTKTFRLQFCKKSFRTGTDDAVELFYKTIPFQGNTAVARKLLVAMNHAFVTSLGTGGRWDPIDGFTQFNVHNGALPSDYVTYNLVPFDVMDNPYKKFGFDLVTYGNNRWGGSITTSLAPILMTAKDGVKLVLQPMLVAGGGDRLMMKISVFMIRGKYGSGLNNTLMKTTAAYDFDLEGLPLVKGVN